MMHRISQKSIYAAQQHALTTQRHGSFVETYGKLLQRHQDKSVQECGYFIEEYGKQIQYYAQESLHYVELLLKTDVYSVDLYNKAVEAHVNAIRIYIQVISRYTLEIQKVINKSTQS